MVQKYTISNDEANRIYKENKKLIHWVANKYKGTLFSYDELEAVAREALIRSANRYKEGAAKLVTFATRNMIRDLIAAHKVHTYHTGKNVSYVGYDNYLVNEQEINNIDIDLNKLLNKLPVRWRAIIIARRIEGKNFKDIAKDMGVSYQRVAEIEGQAMKKLQSLVKS